MQSARSPRAGALGNDAQTQIYLREGTMVCLQAIDLDHGTDLSGGERVQIAADDGRGRTLGWAAYARVYGPRAAVALDVDDAFWHRGLPEVLLARLCDRALRMGISTLLARVPACDLRLLALLREEFAARETRDGSHVDVELATAASPIDVARRFAAAG